jgi:hypothetical protein
MRSEPNAALTVSQQSEFSKRHLWGGLTVPHDVVDSTLDDGGVQQINIYRHATGDLARKWAINGSQCLSADEMSGHDWRL